MHIVIPMYNLSEYSNSSTTSGPLWNYYRGEVNDAANEHAAFNNGINNNKTAASKILSIRQN